MENKKDILSGLRKSQKPVVPDGFYDQFWTDLIQRIENESGFLGQLKKTEKPAVPENFFANLTASIGIGEEEEAGPFDQLRKRVRPTLPANYFDQSTDRIMAAVKADVKNDKKGRVINMRLVTIVCAVAAALLIIFTVINFSGEGDEDNRAAIDKPDENDSNQELLEDENYDDYLAYLDEDEIIDYIIEYDIEIEDTADMVDFDDYSEFSEEDIEDYYFDLL
ncbi:MAG: hypothetical protein ACI8ZM_001470 [Crocinitomix sp.]